MDLTNPYNPGPKLYEFKSELKGVESAAASIAHFARTPSLSAWTRSGAIASSPETTRAKIALGQVAHLQSMMSA